MQTQTPSEQPTSANRFGSGDWLGDLPQDEGWYIAVPPNPAAKPEVVRVRLDIEKQEYVVDAVCQERKYSEELWRYKEW